ncbi:MAG TPA: ATP-binding protein [Bryobacteraceae bacterium]|jgi:signal transduction histidine kinase/ActR/RegA family two-component response regulator|nr:ATP-binding protein [Bryobacteraceae bacterium]
MLRTLNKTFERSLASARRRRLAQYSLPFAGLLAALIAHYGISVLIPKNVDFPYALLYLIAVFASAWYGGYGPGAIACLLTMIGLPSLVDHSLKMGAVDLTRFVALTAVSLAISKVSNVQLGARENLAQANNELDQKVQQRGEDLAQANADLRAEVERRRLTEEKLRTQIGRLHLLDQITCAIGERQDLKSIFQVVVGTLEDNLPIDFGCICSSNPQTESLTVTCLGTKSAAFSGEMDLLEKATIETDRNGMARCLAGDLVYEPDLSRVNFPFPARLAGGGIGSAVAAPLRTESHVFGVLIAGRRDVEGFSSADCEFLRQLSEHVALAAHQAQMYEALQNAYDDLRHSQQSVMEQERLRVLGQMASGIAHDINNALSPVALYTESILERETGLSARTRAYLETTQRAIEDVAHTVGRMREFYRRGETRVALKPVDLNKLARQVVDLTRARWHDIPMQRGVVIEMRTELASGLPPVSGSESEIREALTNLVFNAADAMPQGGTITIGTLSGGGSVRIRVEDTGIGMDEETRRRCLEPFFTTKGERGTGLGLAMVYGVAQRQNADLDIASVPGEGTIVSLVFSAADSGEAAAPVIVHRPHSRLQILIVDDDPLIIRSLRAILEDDGHAVTTATGGQEGIDLVEASATGDEPFAAVITDLGMPYVDGRKVAAAVKAVSRETPVIMLTGWGQRIVAEDDVPPHVDRVLNKPPKLNQLRAALAELLPEATPVAVTVGAAEGAD